MSDEYAACIQENIMNKGQSEDPENRQYLSNWFVYHIKVNLYVCVISEPIQFQICNTHQHVPADICTQNVVLKC